MFEDGTTRVYFLRKALYSLKQALQILYQTFLDFFWNLDFYKTEADHGLFVSSDKTMFIAIYVDDKLQFGTDINPWIDDVIQKIWDRFWMIDLSDISYYLDMEIDVDLSKKTITLWQSIYLRKIFGQYNMSDYRLAKIPIIPGIANFFIPNKNQVKKNRVAWYQSAVGAFIWPAMQSCPNLTYSVGVLSYFCSNPRLAYIKLVKYILQYVSGTLKLSLKFDGAADTPDDMVGYTDSDFAGSKIGQKSTEAYDFMLVGATISHLSKL